MRSKGDRPGLARQVLTGLLWRSSVREEVDAELGFHLEMTVRELMQGGMSEQEAKKEALARFGDVEQVRQECRREGEAELSHRRRSAWLEELGQDARHGVRQLLRSPGFTVAAILTLALGVGATTALFSAVRAVALAPFPWADPDRVVNVAAEWRGNRGGVSIGNFVDAEAAAKSYSVLAAEFFSSLTLDADGGAEQPERLQAGHVTHDFFSVFGARPALGRTFNPEEDAPGADGVVVLGHGVWKARFNADPGVLGRTLRLDGRPRTVIGVMPASFNPSLSDEQVWVPAAFTPEQKAYHDEHKLFVVGRLAPGVSLGAADKELDAIMQDLSQRFPKESPNRLGQVNRLSDLVLDGWDQRLAVTLGAVSLVLLIACANVANLLLARGSARAQELAVRAALGASRGRVMRQLLTESLVLSLAGTAVGVALAAALIPVLVASAPEGIPRLDATRVDGVVLLFAFGVAVACSVAFGLGPALRAARTDLQGALRQGARGLTGGRDRLRSVFVVAQVALAFTLLTGAGLLVRSALHLRGLDPGFQTEGVVAGRISLPRLRYPEPAQLRQAFERIAEAVRAQPGVEAAAVSSQTPLVGGGGSNGLIPEGKAEVPENIIQSNLRFISTGFFETLRIPVVEGRALDARDAAGGPIVLMASRELSRRGFPEGGALGKRFACCSGGPDRYKSVVGIVGDVRTYGPAVPMEPEFYLSMHQVPDEAWRWVNGTMTVVVRGRGGTQALADAIRAGVKEVDPSVPVFQVTALDEALRQSTARERFYTLLLGMLGVCGLLLAAVGISGVVAYFVSLRTHEIGVRLALGAQPSHVLRMLAWQGGRPILLGLVLGALLSVATTRLLEASLYGVKALDPTALLGAAALLGLVGLAATMAPAFRATRVDPSRALAAS